MKLLIALVLLLLTTVALKAQTPTPQTAPPTKAAVPAAPVAIATTMTEKLAIQNVQQQISELRGQIAALQIDICKAHGIESSQCRLNFDSGQIEQLPKPEPKETPPAKQ